jgi:hypothetical protein
MTNPNIERTARVVAAAIVHGTSDDVALDVAQALDDARLIVRPTAKSGRSVPSPAALAALAECRKAKQVADTARAQVEGMPGKPDVSAAAGEVTFVVHPHSLADWKQWTHALGAGDVHGTSTGVSMVVRCTYGGVRARLVGVGVPGMLTDLHAYLDHRTGVRS